MNGPTMLVVLFVAWLAVGLYRHADALADILSGSPQVQATDTVSDGMARLRGR